MFFMMFFWVAVVIGVIYLVGHRTAGSRPGDEWGGGWDYPYSGGAGAHQPGPRTPLQILEERYARGEIERDEFLRRRADLTGF